ncbi:MAG: thioredoxin family protein [Polaromonas sp.]|nr:thioredoxin family protein [Polaromonas sp.]
MHHITSAEQLDALKQNPTAPALLILFGGAHCGVCQAIKPKLESLMAQQFPDIALAYVDCAVLPGCCAQHGVFTLPVVQLFMEGQLCLERVRSFSLQELSAQIARVYRLWQDASR